MTPAARARLHVDDRERIEGTNPESARHRTAAAERFCVNLDTVRGGIEVTTTTAIATP